MRTVAGMHWVSGPMQALICAASSTSTSAVRHNRCRYPHFTRVEAEAQPSNSRARLTKSRARTGLSDPKAQHVNVRIAVPVTASTLTSKRKSPSTS